jgi:hypothetical protein
MTLNPTALLTNPADDPDPEDPVEPYDVRKPGGPRKKPRAWSESERPEVAFTPAWAADRSLLPMRPPGRR